MGVCLFITYKTSSKSLWKFCFHIHWYFQTQKAYVSSVSLTIFGSVSFLTSFSGRSTEIQIQLPGILKRLTENGCKKQRKRTIMSKQKCMSEATMKKNTQYQYTSCIRIQMCKVWRCSCSPTVLYMHTVYTALNHKLAPWQIRHTFQRIYMHVYMQYMCVFRSVAHTVWLLSLMQLKTGRNCDTVSSLTNTLATVKH